MLSIKEITSYPRGTLEFLLKKSYKEFHLNYPEYEKDNYLRFHECDSFFYDNPEIGNSCAFISEYKNQLCGMCCWDPRQYPDGIIGHNCISPEYKGIGLGKEQLGIAIKILTERHFNKLIVSTGLLEFFIPAQRMYQSVGFKEIKRDKVNIENTNNCAQIYYELDLSGKNQLTTAST